MIVRPKKRTQFTMIQQQEEPSKRSKRTIRRTWWGLKEYTIYANYLLNLPKGIQPNFLQVGNDLKDVLGDECYYSLGSLVESNSIEYYNHPKRTSKFLASLKADSKKDLEIFKRLGEKLQQGENFEKAMKMKNWSLCSELIKTDQVGICPKHGINVLSQAIYLRSSLDVIEQLLIAGFSANAESLTYSAIKAAVFINSPQILDLLTKYGVVMESSHKNVVEIISTSIRFSDPSVLDKLLANCDITVLRDETWSVYNHYASPCAAALELSLGRKTTKKNEAKIPILLKYGAKYKGKRSNIIDTIITLCYLCQPTMIYRLNNSKLNLLPIEIFRMLQSFLI